MSHESAPEPRENSPRPEPARSPEVLRWRATPGVPVFGYHAGTSRPICEVPPTAPSSVTNAAAQAPVAPYDAPHAPASAALAALLNPPTEFTTHAPPLAAPEPAPSPGWLPPMTGPALSPRQRIERLRELGLLPPQ
jgi:hypothetical protein